MRDEIIEALNDPQSRVLVNYDKKLLDKTAEDIPPPWEDTTKTLTRF